MRRAIDETERRRHKQQAWNEANGITPQSVVKRIKDIIDTEYDMDSERAQLKAAQTQAKYFAMSEKEVSKEIARLEKEMLAAAKNLEFERAAELRDQLKKLRDAIFVSPL
jgi:excinuclease ABC subunit B